MRGVSPLSEVRRSAASRPGLITVGDAGGAVDGRTQGSEDKAAKKEVALRARSRLLIMVSDLAEIGTA
jgi:hypothetical protein